MARFRYFARSTALSAVIAALACTDGPERTLRPTIAQRDAVKFWETTASTRWNERAIGRLIARPPASNAQAAASRILTYLSLAQYRAVLAAEDGKDRSKHPSVAAAVGGASVAVLTAFFPLDGQLLEQLLDADLAGPQWPGAANQDAAAGEAIGRSVAAAVLALAATDGFGLTSPGSPPVGAGYWTSSGAAIVRSLYGTRPFFISSDSRLGAPDPPVFGSPAFVAALAEVRAISDTRTAEQTALAQFWNTSTGPFTAGAMNRIVVEVINSHHRTERDAARTLAYANIAAFDAQIACFNTKFKYWYIRPSQADAGITLAVPLSNHPSYPSAHSCITSAIMGVLGSAFPDERGRLDAITDASGKSRIYGGLHYRFDVDAGQGIGQAAAQIALSRSLE